MWDEIKAYDSDFYYDIVQWFQDRGMIAPTQYDLPKYGFVIPGVGAGFLISTDTKTAVIDFMITNKKAQKIYRTNAVDKISRALISKARKLGFTSIKCDSQLAAIKEKALSLGFKNTGIYDSFYKEI